MRQTQRFLLVLILLGAIPFFFASRAFFTAFTQTLVDQNEKQLTRPNARTEPLNVVGVKSGTTDISFGTGFKGKDDWLRDLTISYKNRTGKTIVSMTVGLTFPETEKTGNIMKYPVPIGTPRQQALKGERTFSAAADDSITVSLSERDVERLRAFLGQRNYRVEELSRVEVTIDFILFDDGTAWAGQYRIQDPNRPGTWIEDPSRKGVKP